MQGRLDTKAQSRGDVQAGLLPYDMMTVDTKVTMGNIIVITMLVFSMIMAYSKLATKDEVAHSLKELKTDYVRSDVFSLQMGIIDTKIQSINGKIDEIKSDVKDIKRAIKP